MATAKTRRTDASVDAFLDGIADEGAMSTGDWLRFGFAPRRGGFAIYVMTRPDGYDGLLQWLGRHEPGKGCPYVTRLERVDEGVLREVVRASWAASKAAHPAAV